MAPIRPRIGAGTPYLGHPIPARRRYACSIAGGARQAFSLDNSSA
jgi:hypothetical protein